VERVDDLCPALERSTASGKPAVIHVVVDPDANVDPPGNWLWAAARSGKM
jgi:thiamine pyrophosphate-dependent acetolactate synthase large subunit-like protein